MKQGNKTSPGIDVDGRGPDSTWRWLALAVAILAVACSPAVVGRYDRAVKEPMFGPSSRTTPVIETNSWEASNRHGENLTFEFKDGSPEWVTSISHDETSYPLWQYFRRTADARFLFVPFIRIESDGPRYAIIEVDTVERTENGTMVSAKVAKRYRWRK